MKDLIFNIATVNGTGSLSANHFLTKILFRSGWSTASYNFFPSNIAGLPCLYNLRISSQAYTGFSNKADVLISLNPKSLKDELLSLKPEGLLILDEINKVNQDLKTQQMVQNFKQQLNLPLTKGLKDIPSLTVKTRPLLKNMIYVGLLCEWFKIKESFIQKNLEDFFGDKKDLIQQNKQALQIGRELALKNNFPFKIPDKVKSQGEELSFKERCNINFQQNNKSSPTQIGKELEQSYTKQNLTQTKFIQNTENSHQDKQKTTESKKNFINKENQNTIEGIQQNKDILIDGNTSSALGALFAGCQFLSWYPITPASSLAENFEKFANLYQKDKDGKNKFVVLQAEDELSAISQAIGAGWTGLRAMTVTSGPGFSLMSEGAGLSYFAEVPLVLYNVQRAGPSTGLPTRTQQGDLLASCFLSHGGCKHIVLLPGTPEEAFEFTAKAFDLAEELQTLVIVLSDLDLGMNLKMSPLFQIGNTNLKRGKVLKEEDLQKIDFIPYKDVKGDGISYRVLPGTRHEKGAYFNRGSGHNERAEYSEKPEDYSWKLNKLKRKWQTSKKFMPEPVIEFSKEKTTAFVTFGPNEASLKELRNNLKQEGIQTNFMRVRSFPFPQSVENFLKSHSEIFVVEQNKDGQLKQILSGEFPQYAPVMKSLLQYDGQPLTMDSIKESFYKFYSKNKPQNSMKKPN